MFAEKRRGASGRTPMSSSAPPSLMSSDWKYSKNLDTLALKPTALWETHAAPLFFPKFLKFSLTLGLPLL
jgi:hypothetical protein